MRLTSSAFKNEGAIPETYTCDGKNVNPPLSFEEVPGMAKCLVLICDDPDVPKSVRADQMFDHWVVFNIPATVREIEENTGTLGTPGKNTSGRMSYTGPCPPDREHRYFFKLYALDALLKIGPGASKKEVEEAMEGHIVAKATLMGKYCRLANRGKQG